MIPNQLLLNLKINYLVKESIEIYKPKNCKLFMIIFEVRLLNMDFLQIQTQSMEIQHLHQEESISHENVEQNEVQASVENPQKQVRQQPAKKEGQEDHDEQSNTLISAARPNSQRRFGNYIKLVDNSYMTLSLGPDYLCFLPTFIFFSFIGYLLISYINNNVQNIYVIIITHIVCIGQCLSYLLVALSDPGIAHPLTEAEKRSFNRTSFCRKCRFDVPQKTFHCTYCDVCIIGYDHHCPWTSKCIGKNNLILFYIFLFYTPIFIVYSAFAFGFTVDSSARSTSHLRTAGK